MDETQRKLLDLEHEKMVREIADKEREESDKMYAVKLSEKAVFGIVGLMGVTIAGTLIKIALEYINNFLK